MRASWLVVLVLVAVAAVLTSRWVDHPPAISSVKVTAVLLNECLRMYVADFEAFPPTKDTRQVTALLLPYMAPRVREVVLGGREAPRGVRVEFLYPPGAPKAVIANRATFQMVRFRRRGETVVAYADGHLEPPGLKR